MFLSSLQLKNFKNYVAGESTFCEHINCLVGLNGSGKTNILDAIYYLSMTKSNFNTVDAQNILNNEDFFVINGLVNKSEQMLAIHCSLKRGEKKTFKVDDLEYERMSQHLGVFPVVMIAPNDDELIRESSDTRRKFFDSIISQTDKEYLEWLIKYQHQLKQRNALLKTIGERKKVDKSLFEIYDLTILQIGKNIAQKRATFIEEFESHFEANYQLISNSKEKVSITYNSKALLNTFEEEYKKSFERDVILQRTNVGIHRDEYQFEINDFAVKKFGSQGQQKSFLVSLKFAQFAFMKAHLGVTPILLLDDIFDKLDDGRIQKMLEIIASDQFKQIFITDAREERTMSLINNRFDPVKIFRIEDGKISLI